MRRAAILLCLLAAVAACGTDSSASPGALPPVPSTSAPSSAAPATPSASPSALILPAPAGAAETRESATAFGRYWVDALNDAYQRFDPATIVAVSDSSCQACANYVNSLNADRAAHYTYRGGVITTLDAVAPPIEDHETTVSVVVSADRLDVFSDTGAPVTSVPAFTKTTLQVSLQWSGSGWKVIDVTTR